MEQVNQDEIAAVMDQIAKVRPLVAANPILAPALAGLEERLEELRAARGDAWPAEDLEDDAMKSDFLRIKANQKVHPSMLEVDPDGSRTVWIATPKWGDLVVMDGEEMRMSSQRGGGFTKRGADFNDSMVFVGRSGKLEIPSLEWMKLAKKGKIIKRADGKFEIVD